MKMVLLVVLINVAAIAAWSVASGQNGFLEAAKMLRGEPAFIRDTTTGKVSSKPDGPATSNPFNIPPASESDSRQEDAFPQNEDRYNPFPQ